MDPKWKWECIALMAIGAYAAIHGYFAFFKKEYFLVKTRMEFYDFVRYEDMTEEQKFWRNKRARRRGLSLFIFGIVFLITGILLFIFV